MSKHTPGPWFTSDWEIDGGPNEDVIEAREPEVLEPGRASIWPGGMRCMQIASVRDSSLDSETTAANARLIAAAPDLLFQLQAAANYIDALGGDSKSYRAAIAKATGEKT